MFSINQNFEKIEIGTYQLFFITCRVFFFSAIQMIMLKLQGRKNLHFPNSQYIHIVTITLTVTFYNSYNKKNI